MTELQQIYAAKGERQLANNLSRHIRITESRHANKKAGKVHGSTAWEAMVMDVRSSEQRELFNAARERKVALGIIRPRPRRQGDAWQAGQQQQHQQPQPQQQERQQRRGHSRQQTQAQVQQEPDSLAGFDFAAAVQAVQSETATAHRMPGRRRRQALQQQPDRPAQ